jgi:two-component system, LytTR family, response regulator
VLVERVIRYLQASTWPGATGTLERVGLKMGTSIKIVDLADITHFLSKDRLVFAVTTTKDPYLVDQSMDQLERRLGLRQFLRIHRTCIVNVAHVARLPRYLANEPVLWLKNGTQLEVARDRVRAVKEQFGLRA